MNPNTPKDKPDNVELDEINKIITNWLDGTYIPGAIVVNGDLGESILSWHSKQVAKAELRAFKKAMALCAGGQNCEYNELIKLIKELESKINE